MGRLAQDKAGWLGLDDGKTGHLLGCLPLCVGMPIRLNDHLNREKGLVRGPRSTVKQIWFDGGAPTQPNSRGAYICPKVQCLPRSNWRQPKLVLGTRVRGI